MNLHEYQGKSILRSFGVNVPLEMVADTPEKAVEAAKEIKSAEFIYLYELLLIFCYIYIYLNRLLTIDD